MEELNPEHLDKNKIEIAYIFEWGKMWHIQESGDMYWYKNGRDIKTGKCYP